jgi:hypothetical protein
MTSSGKSSEIHARSSGSKASLILISRRFGVSPISHARTAASLDDGFGCLLRFECAPNLQTAVRFQPLEHKCQVGRMEPAQPALQVRGILPLLQLEGHPALRPILAFREHLERAVMLEQVGDVEKGLMKIDRRSLLLHVTPNLHKGCNNG